MQAKDDCTKSTPEPQKQNTLTRRRFLTLSALAALVLAAPDLPPADGPRLTVIDHWLQEIDGTITALDAWRDYLRRVRSVSPDRLDPAETLAIQEAAFGAVYALVSKFDCDPTPPNTDDLLEAITGRPIAEILGYYYDDGGQS